MADDKIFVIVLISFLCFCLVIFTIGFLKENHCDNSITNFGESMCKEHGMRYDSHEFNKDTGIKFYCKNETKLEDGYLVMVS